ncbi:MAG: PAAR domain-containing protein, partial [Rhodocyclaceae bacterium]|nr:PAAR domain-containing protein [Rhodocyclaceae bacterium]
MFEAARVTDGISHTSALTGFLVGAVLGIALIAAVAFATFTCGFGVALLAGLVAGVGASALLAAGEALGKMFSSPAGSITTGSGNVFTNSLQAALVSMSTGVCSKHPPPQVVAEGSSNVFINSQPAARKGDKITCGAKISSGSGNVYIGGGTVQYLPVADEVPQWLRTAVEWAFAIAGIVGGLAGLVRVAGGLSRAMRPCAAKFIAGSVLGEVAGRYVIGPAVERVVGGLLGHPVDMTTGRKLLLAEHEIDFTLIGRLPLTCARFYASNLEHTGALGRGWVLPWEITLQWQPDNIVLRDAQGRETPFPHVPRGSGVYAPAEQRTLSCAPDGRLFLHGADELYYEFDPLDPEHLPPGGIARLRRIEDQAGHWQSYQHDNAGRLTGIRTGAGDHLLLNYAGPQGRLTQIDQVAGGTPGPLVRYEYDEAGQLIAVIDALGHTTRRFGWSGGRMAEHSDALGFSCSYTWQEQGGVARVVRMSTSAGETWTLQHDPGARRASAVDQQGRRAEWHWDQHFQVVDCTDFDASRYRVEYTDAGLPAVVHLPGGRQARTEWDEWGRPVAETDPLGRVTRTAYDGRSLRPAARQWPDGTRETAHYDPRGRLLETTDALGRRERYEYAQDSLPAARIDARGGRAELAWDARGQLTAYTDCSGRTTRYAYDADGHRVARTDAAGNRTTWQVLRDGRIAAQQSADGAQQRYEYDAAGRLCAHHDPLGRSTHWQRDARGLVTRATGPAGHELACRYDSAGRLTELSSANGAAYRYDYDAAGRVAVETRPDGVERRYRYDAAGWLRAIETLGSAQANAANASGGAGPDQDGTPLAAGRSLPPEAPRPRRRIEFERDAMGRLLASTAASAITTYRWDDMDRLREVQRQPTAAGQAQGMVVDLLRFDYDRAGRLVAEHGGHGSVRYELDELDTLAALTLPQGGRITALAYGSGHVHQLSLDDRVLCDIERDALHRRIQISQGKLSTRLGYDPLGRRLWQKTAATLPEGPAAGLAGAAAPGGLLGAAQNGSEAARAADAGLPGLPPGPAAPLWRSYRYDPAGQLLERHDALRGHSRYEYDAAGQLISAAQGETLERFAWDAAGNLQDAIARKSAGLTTDNRLRVWQDLRFDYD